MIYTLQILGVGLLGIGWLVLIGWMVMEKTDSRNRFHNWCFGVGGAVVFILPFAIGISISREMDAKPFDGYVYKKAYEPEHMTFVLSGKVMVPIHVPARWYMVLKSSETGESRSCDIPEQQFESFELGSLQHCGGY